MSAFSDIKRLADSGDDICQFLLGFMYDYGFQTSRNPVLAREWYEAAAKQELALAEYFLYLNMFPIEKDREAGMAWLKRAAESGNVAAESELGAYYWLNPDKEGADELAFKWTKKAADKGYLPARQRLAEFYEKGKHVKKDLKKCRAILRESAEKNDPDCAYGLGSMLLEEGASEEQIEEGLKWIHHAAAHGSFAAYRALSLTYMFGEHGVSPNRQLGDMFSNLSLETLRKEYSR